MTPSPSVEAEGHCFVDADADGRTTWLLPRGTPDSHALRLLTAGVAVVRTCGFEVPPGGACVGIWPPEVLHLPFVEDPGDSVERADPAWREEISVILVAAGCPRPADGDIIVVLEPGAEGPFPGPIEVLYAAGTAGLIVFRNGSDSPDDGADVQLTTSKGIGILNLQGAVGAPPQALAGECLQLANRMAALDPGAFSLWPLWPADDPVAVIEGDEAAGPTALVCFRAPDVGRAEAAFEAAFAAGDGDPPETPS